MSNYIAKVVKVIDDFSVVINKGLEDGFAEGQKYILLGIGEEIIDPETKENLGEIELVRGKVIVKHVQPKMTTLVSDEWMIPGGKRTIKRRTPYTNLFGAEETEIFNEDPVHQPLNSPKVGDVIKDLQ